MKICLAMIVKNESHVIERCLTAAAPFIDTWCIADTGSSDDTVDKIKETMRKLEKKGVLLFHTWADFGTNRTKVFDYVRKHKMADYMLVLDADDVIEGTMPTIDETVGEMEIQSEGISFRQRRLFKVGPKWKYEGKLHEYPTVDGITSTTILSDIKIKHMADGGSWKNQRKKYDEHVEIALSQDLSVPRNQFYLAQSLRAASRFHEAIIEYKKRIEMKDGWYQEAVYSQLMIARLEHTLGELKLAVLDYMKCYEMDSERWEALSELVGLLRKTGNFHLGYLFGKEIMKMNEHIQGKLFLESYENANTILEYGLCAYYSGNKKIAKTAWTRALRMKNAQENVKKTLKENMKWVN